MTFAEYKKKNPGVSDEDLLDDLDEMCGLTGASKEDVAEFCDASDDFYAPGLSKENQLRPVVIYGKRKLRKIRKNPAPTILIIAAIVGIGIWYFKFYKK